MKKSTQATTGSGSAPNLYNMLNNIQGPKGGPLRELGKDPTGREKLCVQYSVPYAEDAPFPAGEGGYCFVNYVNNLQRTYVANVTLNAIYTMTGNQPTVPPIDLPTAGQDWPGTAFFSCLNQLATDQAAMDQFQKAFGPSGNKVLQKAFFDKYMPTNSFSEQDGFTELMEKNSFTTLEGAVNAMTQQFLNVYGMFC